MRRYRANPTDVLQSLKKQFPEFAEEVEDSFSVIRKSGIQPIEGTFTADGTDYIWIESEDEAERIAIAQVKQDLDDDPTMFNKDWLQGFIYITNTDRRIIAGEEADALVDDMDEETILEQSDNNTRYQEIEDIISDLESQERGGAREEYVDEKKIKELEIEKDELVTTGREELRESKYDEVYEALNDPIQYFVHDLGAYSEDDLLKANFISINTNEAAEDAVSTDGWAHFLSTYDGDYETTNDGVVYFRSG